MGECWDSLHDGVGEFHSVFVLEEVASTQNEARRLARSTPGIAVVADRQVSGRGRQGRMWSDSNGQALSMSMVSRSGLPPSGLSLAVGLAVIDACQALGATGLGLKWPNDVVERHLRGRGRKLAGVLIEVADGLSCIGVGLNVGQSSEDWPDALKNSAVSLRQLGVQADRPAVARAVLEAVSVWLKAAPEAIRERWSEIGTLRGQRCVFRVEGRTLEGVVVDLDALWRLVVRCEDGRRVRLDSAHAHLEQVGLLGSLT
ncbi:MAG: biotin--[acetyl-CoA-carboxylase] ligase [Phycisphaerales bacterium]